MDLLQLRTGTHGAISVWLLGNKDTDGEMKTEGGKEKGEEKHGLKKKEERRDENSRLKKKAQT